MTNVHFDFTGQVALITGAAGGIGRSIAEEFAQAGADLILADLDIGPLQNVQWPSGGGRPPLVIEYDASQPQSAQAIVDAGQKTFGRLDMIVPAAGIYPESSVADTSDEVWNRVQNINLAAVFRLIRAALPVLADGGSITTIASVAAHRGSPNHAHYAASKAGVLALTRSLASELGPRIRVNAVSPGTTETPMTEAFLATSRGEVVKSMTPLGRFGQPAEIARVIAFLSSDAAAYVNGEVIHVNGGFFMAG